ncbi:hypothetical protein RQP46_001896 [Phenoliferia psychrophenolica]
MPHRNPAVLDSLLAGNKTFATKFSQEEPVLLKELAAGQHPKIFWLGCSDSRVPESLIVNARPGDLFVHRNIANSFPPSDGSSLAALAYAVAHLGCRHVIVCGHYGCGGIQAAMTSAQSHHLVSPTDEGEAAIAKWLAPVRGLAVAQCRAASLSGLHGGGTEGLNLLVESHVTATVSNISQSSVVQTAWRAGIPLSIHGWCYHVDSGRITDLEVQEGIWEEDDVTPGTKVNGVNGVKANGVKVNGF